MDGGGVDGGGLSAMKSAVVALPVCGTIKANVVLLNKSRTVEQKSFIFIENNVV